MRRFTLALLLLSVPLLTHAQVRGGGARAGGGAHMIMAPRPAAAAHAPVYSRPAGSGASTGRVSQLHTGATYYSGPRTVNGRPVSRAAVQSGARASGFLPDFTGVPGLGFDFAHYAAVHPGWNGRRGRNGPYLGYYPFFDSGFLLPYPQSYVASSDDGPVYQGQGGDNSDAPGDPYAGGDRGYGPRTVSSYDVVVSPQAPSQAYVFVRRDGTVFFAVAYSFESGNLYYVTQEGFRRSESRDSLDLNATQQFNEQRGLSFHIPVTS
jgi:hypothetical protein